MSIYNMKSFTLKKDASTLDCVVFGTGRKSLVLIPGLSFQRVRGAALPLAYMYRIFSKEYKVYVVDKKETIPHGYTIREMADDTAFVIEQLGIGPADVLGISQGGMIAQYLAIDHPLLVNKLALGVTASRQNGTMQGVINNWIQLAKQSEYQAIVIDMLKNMYSPAYIKKYGWLFPLLSRIGKPKDFSRFIALAEACLTCNAYSELDKISCPVFVIGGSKDRIVTGRASEEIAKKLNCEMYMYPELGHSAYEEATDFNARIYRFLTE